MNQLELFRTMPRPWLKSLALAALRQPEEIEFDEDDLRIYPVRNDQTDAKKILPRYEIKSLTWLTDFHQLVNSMAMHRDEHARAAAAIRAKFETALNELTERFQDNEECYIRDLHRMLGQVERVPPKLRPIEQPPDWAIDHDDVPF